MPIEIVSRYTREEIQANPDKRYIFGDNYAREGFGGQAKETRGEPNTIGIITKKAPTYNLEDFMTDDEYASNVGEIYSGFMKVIDYLRAGNTVVWPKDGIGTGRANLKEKAPRTLAFIDGMISAIIYTYGVK